MRAQAMMVAAVLAASGCTTKFESDASTDATPDSTDTIVEEEVEIPEGCGNGEVEEGEECEGDAAEVCWTECGLEGHHECNPVTCQWRPCTAPENCRNGCDDDGDDWTDCSDLEDCESHPDCSGCPDDDYEDNDGPDMATSWTSGDALDLYLCPDDDDWFGGLLSLGDRIQAEAMFTHGEGNIDMDLVNPSGSTVAFAATITDDETLEFVADASGMYHLRVYLSEDPGADPGNAYGLTVDIERTPCEDDMFEDNDSLTDERIITRGSHPGLVLCPGDDDYYAATYSGSSTDVTITVEFSHAEGNIDLYLLDGSGGVLASSTSTDDDEVLTWTLGGGDTAHLRVTLAGDSGTVPGNTYDLSL